MLRVLRAGEVLPREVSVLRARRELSGSALRRSGTPELVRRTLEGAGVLLRAEGAGTLSFTRRALEGVESSMRGVLERDGVLLRAEGEVLREDGAGLGELLRDEGAGLGVALREGDDARGEEGAGEGVLERGVEGVEDDFPPTRLPPPLEGELLRDPPDGTEPPLAREPPEGAELPLAREPPEGVEPPLFEPPDPPLEPRPPMARWASAGMASMNTPESRSTQRVRYLKAFMNGLISDGPEYKKAQTPNDRQQAGAPRFILRARPPGSMAQSSQIKVPDCWQF